MGSQRHKLKRKGRAGGFEPASQVGDVSYLVYIRPIAGSGELQGVAEVGRGLAVDQPGGDRSRQVEHLRRPAVDRPGGQGDPAIPSEDRPFGKNC